MTSGFSLFICNPFTKPSCYGIIILFLLPTLGVSMEREWLPKHLQIAYDDLLDRARLLFQEPTVWNNFTTDHELIEALEKTVSPMYFTDKSIRLMILTHRKSITMMPSMAEGAQITFLAHQLEVERLLNDFDQFLSMKEQWAG